MTYFVNGNLGDQSLAWGFNVLAHATLIAALALAIGATKRRNAAERCGVLCAALLLILAAPVVTGVSLWSNRSLISVDWFAVEVTKETPPVGTVSPAGSAAPTSDGHFPVLPDRLTEGEHRIVPNAGPSAVTAERPPAINTQLDRTASATETVHHNRSVQNNAGGMARASMFALLAGWGIGSLLSFVRLARGWIRVARILRDAKPNTDETLARAFNVAQAAVSVRPMDVVISDRISGPMLAGLRRPRIIFPTCLIGRLTTHQARDIFLHELAHGVRRDQAIVLLQNVAMALFWIHPLVRVLNRQLAQAREEVCDNYVLTTTDAPSYSRTLLSLAELIQSPAALPGTIGLFTSRWKLERRVADLLDRRRNLAVDVPRSKRAATVVVSLAMLFAAAFATISSATDQDDADRPSRKPQPAATVPEKIAVGTHTSIITGTITDAEGRPVADAFVSIVGTKVENTGGRSSVIAETHTDNEGRYRFELADISLLTLRDCSVMARAVGLAVDWQPLDIGRPESIADFSLAPEVPIELALIDTEGQPAANVVLKTQSISVKDENSVWFFQDQPGPQALTPPVTTDENGRVTVPHVAAENGIRLVVVGDEKFARQMIALHKGTPPDGGEGSRPSREILEYILPGEKATLVLAPARFIEGVVYLGETDRPAANAKVTIWASQQEFGSMLSIEGKTDAEGRFRMNPYSGVRFGLQAYPPAGTPYLPTSPDPHPGFKFEGGARVRHVEIRLPAAPLARGRIVDAETGQPLEGGSVQYIRRHDNPHEVPEVSTGWQNMQLTDAEGNFAITVLPGPGTLMFHAPLGSNYVLTEMGSRELYYAKPGGQRHYAHAFVKIDPPEPDRSNTDPAALLLEPMTVKLQPGGIVVANLVDSDGKPIEQAISTSRVETYPFHPTWRAYAYAREVSGGQAIFQGLEQGVEYPAFIVDDERHLGATAMISLDNPTPTIVLTPLGSAKARFIDAEGKPVKSGLNLGLSMVGRPGLPGYHIDHESPEFNADETYYVNFNRHSRPLRLATDENGVQRFPMLIPGTTYRVLNLIDDKFIPQKEFIAESGKEHDMGDIVVDVKE
ncbi:MAG: M56 family metallopeptidase [Planctomycetaceae bacterium]